MKLRPILFWSHLTAGVLAGVFLFILSITGLLLTYEHAIIDVFAKSETISAPAGRAPQTADQIAGIARQRTPGAMVYMVNFENRAGAPVIVHPIGKGGLDELTLNPFTGENFAGASVGVKAFFEKVVGWHRWLGVPGIGRAITGAANLVFLFIVLSGIYLWLPKVWKWVLLRPKILFRRNAPAGKARDYNWHHVFSFWSLLPLVLIVGSAVIISYPWANAAFYRAFGAQAPKQGGPAFIGELRKDAALAVPDGQAGGLARLQDAVDAAKASQAGWTKISLFVHPKGEVPIARVMVHTGNGVLPEQMTTLIFDRRESRVTAVQGYDDLKPAERARMWIRFVHTGEQYGFLGSTLAGLASLAAAFLVYTGLALALRRYRDHLAKKRANTGAGV